LDAFYANKFGDVNLGGRITYAEQSNSIDTGFLFGYQNIQSENWGFSLGMGLNDWAGFNKVNFHVDYDVDFFTAPIYTYYFEDGTVPIIENQGIQSFRLGTLMDSTLSKDSNLRLFGDAKFDQFKILDWTEPVELNFNQKDIDLGAAINQKVFDGKGLITSGLILDYYAAKETDLTNGTIIDAWDVLWNVAAEAEVASWLTLRTGLEFPLFARAWEGPVNDVYSSNAPSDTVAFSMGAGINYSNFILDLKVNQESLESAISDVHPGQGLLTAGNMFTVEEADLSYKF
jgi:hypothetical protein